MAYRLTIEVHATYLHAKAEGPRTPENALRALKDINKACVESGRRDVLVEMSLEGPGFEAGTIYNLIEKRAPEGVKLGRIAYVENAPAATKTAFVENLAVNRGVNLKLFADVDSARRWLVANR